MRESFVFYESFLDAIEELDDKNQLKIYKSIAHFALKDEEPDDLKGIAKAIFSLIKPQILANNKRFEDGKKGGRPRNKKTTGFENEKTTGYSEKKPNVNVNDNVNDNVNVNENVAIIHPTKNQIEDFCKTQGIANVDIDDFYLYYSSNNWFDSYGKPVNWKQKIVSWKMKSTKEGIPNEQKPYRPYG